MSAHKDIRIELWNLDDLIPYDLNAKKHEPEQVSRIAQSILKLGFDVPIVVDQHGVIIKGHGRRLALKSLVEQGYDRFKKVPVVIRADLSPDEAKAARLADNRVALSDIDPDKLKADLAGLNYDLSGIFDDKELDFLDADLGLMNDAAFVTDMDATIADQKADLNRRIEAAAGKAVPLTKAFGFKEVPAGMQLPIARLMALAEQTTGMKGVDAFVNFLSGNIQTIERECGGGPA